jgi:hypothetical protein
MMHLKDIKKNPQLLDAIDWDMTPEEAVRLYLEWGNNWAGGKYVIRSKDDVAHYFVVNTWEQAPRIFLVKRNSEEAVELAAIDMPGDLQSRYFRLHGRAKGVYALDGELRNWLKNKLFDD